MISFAGIRLYIKEKLDNIRTDKSMFNKCLELLPPNKSEIQYAIWDDEIVSHLSGEAIAVRKDSCYFRFSYEYNCQHIFPEICYDDVILTYYNNRWCNYYFNSLKYPKKLFRIYRKIYLRNEKRIEIFKKYRASLEKIESNKKYKE